jgi:hypothetical protein
MTTMPCQQITTPPSTKNNLLEHSVSFRSTHQWTPHACQQQCKWDVNTMAIGAVHLYHREQCHNNTTTCLPTYATATQLLITIQPACCTANHRQQHPSGLYNKDPTKTHNLQLHQQPSFTEHFSTDQPVRFISSTRCHNPQLPSFATTHAMFHPMITSAKIHACIPTLDYIWQRHYAIFNPMTTSSSYLSISIQPKFVHNLPQTMMQHHSQHNWHHIQFIQKMHPHHPSNTTHSQSQISKHAA